MARPRKQIQGVIEIDGTTATLKPLEKIENKKPKTLYLTKETLDTLDEFERLYGIKASATIDRAVMLLKNTIVKDGIK